MSNISIMNTPKFLCDEMLTGLGRWLRTAGYDTVIAEPGTPDRILLEQALNEDRTLVTRDRKLMEMRNATAVALLITTNELDDCIKELTHTLAIDWELAPFSRCLICNTALQLANQSICQRVPEDVRSLNDKILYCPQCDKPYWQGSHTKRMRQKLKSFQPQ